jgi:hypothetical protein
MNGCPPQPQRTVLPHTLFTNDHQPGPPSIAWSYTRHETCTARTACTAIVSAHSEPPYGHNRCQAPAKILAPSTPRTNQRPHTSHASYRSSCRACGCATPPPPQAPPSNTETCAATSGTIPLRLCVRRDFRPSPTKGARRPKLRRGLRGPGSSRWGYPACAAFARATPTAVVATPSAGVLPCGPAPRRPTFDEVDVQTRR